jgi:NUMOD4 motif-containing protein/NUMOD1 domain-containing protein
MRKELWPYQDTLLKDRPGEVWHDMPGFDGEYEISSFGRVKSLRRWHQTGSNNGYYTTDKIVQQHARFKKGQSRGKDAYTVGVTLKSNGRSISRSTARYVYHAFVEPFDLNDQSILISYNDHDGRNIHYPNLSRTTRSEMAKKSILLKRSHPRFIEYSLPVRQLTIDGKLIKKFSSLTEAARKTGINLTAIAACVEGRTYQSHGFLWEAPTRTAAPAQVPAPASATQVFNEYLWKKLGAPATSRTHPIAALNLSLETMKGEQWKPIEGLEKAFMVSNFGRIKGLSRFKVGRLYVWTKETIKRLIPDGKKDKPTSCLLTQLTKNGKKYQQSVSRLVYHHFVEKIDLADRQVLIRYKNGKCYDLDPKNLYVA